MRTPHTFLLFLLLGLVLLWSGCPRSSTETEKTTPSTSPAPAKADPGEALLNAKCTVCHDLARVEKHDPQKEPWAEVVKSMQAKKPGQISDADAAAITDYLNKKPG